MKANQRSILLVFATSALVLLNCATLQGLIEPPTFTPTKTATNTPAPTETSTASLAALPTENELIGTRWTLIDDAPNDGHREYDIIFHKDRRLETFHPNDNTPNNDSWKLVGTRLTMSMNNAYSVYIGNFVDANTIEGTAENTEQDTWEWVAHRKAD
jgi:hypothetical protein